MEEKKETTATAARKPKFFLLSFLLLLSFPFLLFSAPRKAVLQNVPVRPGDTLWAISNKYLKDPTRWNEILRHNSLPTTDPTVALPGMILKVPVELIKDALRSARLIYLLNEVLYRQRETARWKPARRKMNLYPEDGLRTMAESEARVKFVQGDILKVSPNSMVIVTPPRKNTDVRLLKGEVYAGRSKVLTASAFIIPKTKDTRYSARVKEDLTTLVRVFKGRAVVEAKGETLEVFEGFGSEIRFDMPPSKPVRLPELEEFSISAKGVGGVGGGKLPRAVLVGSRLSIRIPKASMKGPRVEAPAGARVRAPKVTKELKFVPVSVGVAVQGYHVQMSHGRDFARIVFDRIFDVMETVDFGKLKLPSGKLYWRVALIDLLGFEGKFSPPRLFGVGGGELPRLDVLSPREGERVRGGIVRVQGVTDPGSSVTVDGFIAGVDEEGNFAIPVELKPGKNAILIESERLGKFSRVVRNVTCVP